MCGGVCTHMCACGSQPCSGKAQVLRVMFKYQHQSSPRGARQAEPRCRHNKGLVTAIFSQGPRPGCLGPTALRLRRCGPGGCWCGGGGRGCGENPGWSLAQQAPWLPGGPVWGEGGSFSQEQHPLRPKRDPTPCRCQPSGQLSLQDASKSDWCGFTQPGSGSKAIDLAWLPSCCCV